MEAKYNLSQLAELLYKEGGIQKADAEQFAKAFFDLIADAVTSGQQVKIKGLGTFKPLEMSDRESVNVNTGERIVIPGYTKISFTPDAALKDDINKPYADFEIVAMPSDISLTSEPVAGHDTTMEPEAVEEPEPAVKPEPVAATEPEPVAATEPEPVAEPVKPKRKGGLRLLLTVLSILLVVLLITYCLWPVNLLHQIRLGMNNLEKNLSNGAAVAVEQVDINHVDSLGQDTAVEEKLIAEVASVPETKPVPEVKTKPEVKPEPVKEVKPEPVKEVKPEPVKEVKPKPVKEVKPAQADKTSSKVNVVLPAKVETRALDTFSYADTLDMVMTGTAGNHVLQPGETLTKVALDWYGTKKLWPYIAAYNHISNASRLKSGQTIKVPQLKAK